MLNLANRKLRIEEARKQQALVSVFSRSLRKGLKSEFRRVAHAVAGDFRHHHKLVMAEEMKAHKDRLTRILGKSVTVIMRASAARTKMFLKPAKKATEEEVDQEIEDFIGEYTAEHVTSISETTRKRIVDAIQEGNANDLSYDQIADLIEKRTGGRIGDARARIIAQTEMHSASQAGSIFSARSMGIDGLLKSWVSTNDNRTRDDHAEADGQSVPVDDAFKVGTDSLDYPGDPNGSAEEVINCRCVVVYDTQEIRDIQESIDESNDN